MSDYKKDGLIKSYLKLNSNQGKQVEDHLDLEMIFSAITIIIEFWGRIFVCSSCVAIYLQLAMEILLFIYGY